MIALAITLLAVIGLATIWAACESAAIKQHAAGRRDQHAGTVDRSRMTNLDYVDGATTEYLRRTGGAA